MGAQAAEALVNIIKEVAPTETRTSISDAFSKLSSIVKVAQTPIVDNAAWLLLNGIVPENIQDIIQAYKKESNRPEQTALEIRTKPSTQRDQPAVAHTL